MKLEFYGAAQTVTGSNYILDVNNRRIMIDCGLYQGCDAYEKLNAEPFHYNIKDVDALILTHGHIDHIGRIPKLVRDGYDKKIYTTKATQDLAPVMLYDACKIQQNDLETENRKRLRRGEEPLSPIYEETDVEKALNLFEGYRYGQMIEIFEDISVRFLDAGHILGSAIAEVFVRNGEEVKKIVFSGDLGMPGKPLINDPTFVEDADFVVMESTYGSRNHEAMEDSKTKLFDIIDKTLKRGGTVLIPSFAVERTQDLLYFMNERYDKMGDAAPKVYIDSPMAVDATEVFQKNADVFDDETREMILSGDSPFKFPNLTYVRSVEDSRALNENDEPKIVIASSGMMTAGRIRHHLKHGLWNPLNSLIVVGYQAEGSLGRILLDGVKKVKLFGEMIDVKLEIHDLEGFSAHADQKMLLKWLGAFKKKPKKVILVHGEKESQDVLKAKIEEELDMDVFIPRLYQTFDLDDGEIYDGRNEEAIRESMRKELEDKFSGLSKLFEEVRENSDRILERKEPLEEYIEIKNKLIDIEAELVNVSSLLAK